MSDPGHVHAGNAGIGVGPTAGVVNGQTNGVIVIQSDGNAKNTTSATTGITAAFNLNGNVTQTSINGMQPTITAECVVVVLP